MTAKLEKCAEILGVKVDSLESFPDEIKDKLVNLTENEKLNLMYEYAIGTDKDTLLKIIES